MRRAGETQWRPAWASHVSSREARLRLQSFASLLPGEALEVDCRGDGTAVRFSGLVLAQAGQDLALSISGPLTFGPSEEDVRLSLEGVEGRMWDEGGEAALQALDASPTGLGGLCERAFAQGGAVGIELRTPLGLYAAQARVVNCRAEGGGTGHHRIGLRVESASRLDAALWNRMLRERAGLA